MHNETLASEIIKDMLDEKHMVMMELECLDPDFEKTLFALDSAQNTLESMREPKSINDAFVQFANVRNALMNISIVFDYLVKLQTDISDIVAICHEKSQEEKE